MKRSLLVLMLCLGACNWDAGECIPRFSDGDGAGGNIISSPGTGGFGEAPPEPTSEPQDEPDPANPCAQTAECTVNWKAGSEHCKSQGTQGACTTLYQGVHTSLSGAKERCESVNGVKNNSEVESCSGCRWLTAVDDCLDHCKDLCVEKWETCYDNCGKDTVCREKCMQQLQACFKECEKKCK